MSPDAPDWELVEKLVGLPDYAVGFALWPWPDGGWYAGITLTDRKWAEEQGLAAASLNDDYPAVWNLTDGFVNGVNEHAGTAAEAVENLARRLGVEDLGSTEGAKT